MIICANFVLILILETRPLVSQHQLKSWFVQRTSPSVLSPHSSSTLSTPHNPHPSPFASPQPCFSASCGTAEPRFRHKLNGGHSISVLQLYLRLIDLHPHSLMWFDAVDVKVKSRRVNSAIWCYQYDYSPNQAALWQWHMWNTNCIDIKATHIFMPYLCLCALTSPCLRHHVISLLVLMSTPWTWYLRNTLTEIL